MTDSSPYWGDGELDGEGNAYRKGREYGERAARYAADDPDEDGNAAMNLAVDDVRRRRRMKADSPDPATYVPVTSFIAGFVDGAQGGAAESEATRVTLVRFIEALVLSEHPRGYHQPEVLPEYLRLVPNDDGTMRIVHEDDDEGLGSP